MDSKEFIQIKREKTRRFMFSSRMSEEDMGQLAAKDPVENIVSEGSS
jgi:hypothetical protein